MRILFVFLFLWMNQSAISSFMRGEETGQGIAALFSRQPIPPVDDYLLELQKISAIFGPIPAQDYAPKAQYIKDQLDDRVITADINTSLNNILTLIPGAGTLYTRIGNFAISFDQDSVFNLNTALINNKALVGGPANQSLKINIMTLRDLIKARAMQGASMLVDLNELATIIGGNVPLIITAAQIKGSIDGQGATVSIVAAITNLQNIIAGNNALDLLTQINQYINILYANSNPKTLNTAITVLQNQLGGPGDIYTQVGTLQANFQILATENANAKVSIGTAQPNDISLPDRINELGNLVPGIGSVITRVSNAWNTIDGKTSTDLIAGLNAISTLVGNAVILQGVNALKVSLGTLTAVDPTLAQRVTELDGVVPGANSIIQRVRTLKDNYDVYENTIAQAKVSIGTSQVLPLDPSLSDRIIELKISSSGLPNQYEAAVTSAGDYNLDIIDGVPSGQPNSIYDSIRQELKMLFRYYRIKNGKPANFTFEGSGLKIVTAANVSMADIIYGLTKGLI